MELQLLLQMELVQYASKDLVLKVHQALQALQAHQAHQALQAHQVLMVLMETNILIVKPLTLF